MSTAKLSKAELFRHEFPQVHHVFRDSNENDRSYLQSLLYLAIPNNTDIPSDISAHEAAEMICGIFPQYPSSIAQVVQGLCELLDGGIVPQTVILRLGKILNRERARQLGLLAPLPTVEEVVKNYPDQPVVEAFAHAIGGGRILEALSRQYGSWVAQDPILAELVFQAEQASADHDESSGDEFVTELVRQINRRVVQV